jgi:hypothetical protein
MSREFDARTAAKLQPGNGMAPEQHYADESRNPSRTVAASDQSSYIERATAVLQSRSAQPRSAGSATAPSAGSRYRIDPAVVKTNSGGAAVHAREEYNGILVFQSADVVRFSPDGTVESSATQPLGNHGERSSIPRVSSVNATIAAAHFVAAPTSDEAEERDQFGEPRRKIPVDLSGFSPKILSERGDPERHTLLGGEPLPTTVSASLIWFPLDGDLRLTWEIVLTLPSHEPWRVLVDADNQNILYSHCLTLQVMANANVYLPDGNRRAPAPESSSTHRVLWFAYREWSAERLSAGLGRRGPHRRKCSERTPECEWGIYWRIRRKRHDDVQSS